MADFPGSRATVVDGAPLGVLSTWGMHSPIGAYNGLVRLNAAAAVWPSASLVIYQPVIVPETVTVYQLGVEVTTQAGNIDLGIYDENFVAKVTKGSTATAAAGVQTLDITDTVLTPGLYFFAMGCDSATAAFRRVAPSSTEMRMCGCFQQATFPCPTTSATYGTMAQSYSPHVFGSLTSVAP